MQTTSEAPAGWYPDPGGAGQRYWDGSEWTDQVVSQAGANAPAGWYSDPGGQGERYWDGTSWTDKVAPAQLPPSASTPPQAPATPPPDAQLATPAWLHHRYSDAVGTLELSGGRLRFTTTQHVGKLHAKWIAKHLGQSDIAERLHSETGVTVFDAPLSEVRVFFPGIGMGTLMSAEVSGVNWHLVFADPTGASPGIAAAPLGGTGAAVAGASALANTMAERTGAKPWRELFGQ